MLVNRRRGWSAIPYESRCLLRLRNAQLARDQALLVRRIIAEVGEGAEMPSRPGTAAGDTRKLRGIPALAPGVAGEMRNTRPDTAVHD